MTESMKYYESIRRKYPETVSKDQFYQIAHILSMYVSMRLAI